MTLALPVARPGESLGAKSRCSLALLCDRQRSESGSGSRRTKKLLQRLDVDWGPLVVRFFKFAQHIHLLNVLFDVLCCLAIWR